MANPKKIDYYVLLQTRKHPIFKVDDWFQKFGNVKRQKLKKLFAAQNGLCFYCENPMRWVELEELQRNGYRSKGLDVTLDHKIPKSRGGTDSLNNLVACCSTCNNRKGDVSFEKFVENHKLDLREKSLEDVRLEVDDKDLIFKAIEALYGPNVMRRLNKSKNATPQSSAWPTGWLYIRIFMLL